MTRTYCLVTALLLTLAVSLAACGTGDSQAAEPSVTSAGDPVGGVSLAAEPAAAPAGEPVAGEKLFVSVCAGCHGLKGEGIASLSKDLAQSGLVTGTTDQELVEFIKTGRAPGDSLNAAGDQIMPPKGGNPALTDQNLVDIVAYIRSLQN